MVRKVPLVVLTPHPQGGKRAKGSLTTGAAYATVCSLTPVTGKYFQVCKILVSCDKDVQYKLQFGGVDISIEVILSANTPFPDWFAWNAYSCLGDGAKTFAIQAKYPTGGSAGTCFAEIHGEEQ